jgi:prevent-host-death family protein
VIIKNIHQAKTELSKLIAAVENGEEVVIAKAGKPVAKIISYSTSDRKRTGGQWQGRVSIAEDFDQLPADIAAAFGLVPGHPERQSPESRTDVR